MPGTLDEHFPGYRDCDVFEADRFRGHVLEHRREVRRHPCYVHGYEIGEDIETLFSARVLVLPPPGSDADGWCVLESGGYSLASERYDQDSRSVRCRLSNGEGYSLEHRTMTQKPGRRPLDERGDLGLLAAFLRDDVGYAEASDEAVEALVRAFTAKYCG